MMKRFLMVLFGLALILCVANNSFATYVEEFDGTVTGHRNLYDFILGWDVDIDLIYDDDGTFTSYDSGLFFRIINPNTGNWQYGADFRGSWMNETITDEFIRFDSTTNDQYAILNLDSGTFEYETSSNFVQGTLSAVPVPAAIWLLGSGLVGLAGLRKRMKS